MSRILLVVLVAAVVGVLGGALQHGVTRVHAHHARHTEAPRQLAPPPSWAPSGPAPGAVVQPPAAESASERGPREAPVTSMRATEARAATPANSPSAPRSTASRRRW